jgi:putative transposase
MRYQFIDQQKKAYPVTLMREVLEVTKKSYYEWRQWKPGPRVVSNEKLDRQIQRVFRHHKGRFEATRIADELNDKGIPCSEPRGKTTASAGAEGLSGEEI